MVLPLVSIHFSGNNTPMSAERNQRLRTPQGTEGFFLEEAYRHRQLLRMTEDHFSSWGYLPVLTPVFDYFETYRPLLNSGQIERSYRFPDREGELLMLRSDITLFLAKQMGITLDKAPLPRRVYYADSILRHQEDEDISSDEFFQSGAELIGLPGRDGDMEILILLHSLLSAMELSEWRMHIGSRSILDSVLAGRADSIEAGRLLELRDKEALEDLFRNAGLPNAEARVRLLLFLGTVEEFNAAGDVLAADCIAGDSSANPEDIILKAVSDLKSLTTDLTGSAGSDHIRVDLSEHGGQPYYTGFTVKAYAEGSSTAIASGGRYDDLLGSFGKDVPAAGFSLLMRKIEPLSGYAARAAERQPVGRGSGENFADRYLNAVQRRRKGERVTL